MDIQAGTYHWEITPGDLESRVFEIVDEDDNPIDLTGTLFQAQFRAHRNSVGEPDAQAYVALVDGYKVTVVLSSAQTRALGDSGHRRYFWDLQGGVGDSVTTFLKGTATLTWDVTR